MNNFLWGSKNCQSWKRVLFTKLFFCQKNQKHPLKRPRFMECPKLCIFKFPKKYFFWVFYFTKESLILSPLKQNILDEIKQSNAIRPQKNLFFRDCWLVSSSQRKFLLESVLKIIYTFYLKHHVYPFCAPIFHPISETESNCTHFANWFVCKSLWIFLSHGLLVKRNPLLVAKNPLQVVCKWRKPFASGKQVVFLGALVSNC